MGTCQYGYGYGGTGKKSNNRQFDDFGGPFGKNDVIGCYLDLDNKEIAYTKNGQDLGLAFNIPKSQSGQTFFPAVVLKVNMFEISAKYERAPLSISIDERNSNFANCSIFPFCLGKSHF